MLLGPRLYSVRSDLPPLKWLRRALLIRPHQRVTNSAVIARCSSRRAPAHWSMARSVRLAGANSGSRKPRDRDLVAASAARQIFRFCSTVRDKS